MEKLKNLTAGVDRLFIENKRFNTTLISVNFYLPLTKRGLSLYAILSGVMSSVSKNYPSFSELNLRQKELYSTIVGASSAKQGDRQLVKFYASFLNNDLVLEDIYTPVSELLLELIFNPLIENKAFLKGDVAREKRLITEKLKSLVNEKRAYIIDKTTATMFSGTPYATNRYGDILDIETITESEIYDAYLEMLKSAYIRIQVTGKEYNGEFDEAFLKAIAPFRKEDIAPLCENTAKKHQKLIEATEKAPIKQAKLCMGFTMEKTGDIPASSVCVDILGGGPYSLLFTNVREKLSLCYYCAARLTKNKGLLMIDSGVEAKNIEKAKAQILIELEKLQKGDFSEELISTSKRAILESLKANNDSDIVLDNWYSLRSVSDLYSPEEYANRVSAVTKEEIMAVANSFKLDTVFALLPEENDEN